MRDNESWMGSVGGMEVHLRVDVSTSHDDEVLQATSDVQQARSINAAQVPGAKIFRGSERHPAK